MILARGCGWLAVACTAASFAHADAIDDYVRATMAREKVPGLVLGIATGVENSPVRNYSAVRTYGVANLELDVQVRATSIFQSGSVGKQFTAAVVLMLVDDGRLDLDDPIAKFFPGGGPRWRDITVRHLLTHTSGLPEYTEGAAALDMRRDYTEEELVRFAMQLEPQFIPGVSWNYSNTGYVVLGALIRKVTGEFYGDVLRERIFKPAGMTTARIISEADVIANRADGYERVDGQVRNQTWVAPSLNTTADGALYLSMRDLLEWDAALRSRKLLSPASYATMWKPVSIGIGTTFPYGMGWAIDEQRGSLNIEHSGSWQGFKAHIARYVERGLSVMVMCNLDACPATSIAHEVAGLIDPTLKLPDPEKAGTDDQPQRTRALRDALTAWSKSEKHALMSPAFASLPDPAGRTKAARGEIAAKLAAAQFIYLAQDDVRGKAIERNGSRVGAIVHCAVVTRDAEQPLRFFLDERGSLVEIDL